MTLLCNKKLTNFFKTIHDVVYVSWIEKEEREHAQKKCKQLKVCSKFYLIVKRRAVFETIFTVPRELFRTETLLIIRDTIMFCWESHSKASLRIKERFLLNSTHTQHSRWQKFWKDLLQYCIYFFKLLRTYLSKTYMDVGGKPENSLSTNILKFGLLFSL